MRALTSRRFLVAGTPAVSISALWRQRSQKMWRYQPGQETKTMRLMLICMTMAAVCAAMTAEAQTLPPTGQLWFVGSTEELEDIRAALREAECLRQGPLMEICTHRGSVVTCEMIPNPYCAENTYPFGGQAQAIGSGLGLGAVDCMMSFVNHIAQDLGTTVLVGTDEIYIPSIEELVDDSGLPAACYDHLVGVICDPNYPEEWCYLGCAPPC